MANARADPKLPAYPPLHFLNGAVECASGGDDGGGNDGDGMRSFNPRGDADFPLLRSPSPARR